MTDAMSKGVAPVGENAAVCERCSYTLAGLIRCPRTGTGQGPCPHGLDRISATRAGRWGVHQLYKGEHTGGGTVGLGWATEQEAREQNPPVDGVGGTYTYEPFERAL